MIKDSTKAWNRADRQRFIGGSDARVIMGDDAAALLRLWREKRGEIEPEDLSGNLIVQLGLVTEPLNRHWYERNTRQVLTGVQSRVQHPVVRWMAATLDGVVEVTGSVFARLHKDLIAALRPMRARRPQARFAMLSTAWSRTDPFWAAWASDDPSWLRLKATADTDPTLFAADFLKQEHRALGEDGFKRGYLGIPIGAGASPFTWDLYDRATQVRVPLVPPGPAFRPSLGQRAVPVANPFRGLRPIGVVQ